MMEMVVWWVLLSVLLLGSEASFEDQTLREDLFIKHLPDARVMAHFEFSVTWDVHPLIFAGDSRGKEIAISWVYLASHSAACPKPACLASHTPYSGGGI
jgi:hypothetical protein